MLGSCLVSTIAHGQPQGPPSIPLPPSVVVAEHLFPALQPMIQSAARQSLRTLSANIESLIAEETRKVVHARLLPLVWLNSTWSLAQDQRLGQPDPVDAEKLAYFFQIKQPLYHWGALKAGENAAKIGVKIAENNATEVHRLLVLEVRSAYLRMILQKALFNRAKFALGQTEEEARVAKSKLDSGTLAPAEIYPIYFRLEQGRLDVEMKEEDYRLSRFALERLAGVAPIADEAVPVLIPHVPYSAESVMALVNRFMGTDGVKETAAVANAQLRLDQEKLNYRIAATNLRPKFNVVTGVTQDEVSYTGSAADRARIRTYYGGFGVDWTFFDGLSTRAQLRASKLRMRQIEADRDEKVRQHLDWVQNQTKQLDFAFRKTEASEKILAVSDGFVAALEENVKRGTATVRNVESAKLSRDDALNSAMFARIEYLGKLAEFLSAIRRDPALENAYFPSRP